MVNWILVWGEVDYIIGFNDNQSNKIIIAYTMVILEIDLLNETLHFRSGFCNFLIPEAYNDNHTALDTPFLQSSQIDQMNFQPIQSFWPQGHTLRKDDQATRNITA